jgi:predicted TPR repeat methyltransferase
MDTNRFDDKAATWDDDPAKVERASDIAGRIETAVPLDGSTRLLEYGAGTGLVTQALRHRVGRVTLVDTSAGMRAVMQSKIDAGVLTDARVWATDLASEPPPADERFDLVVTVMTLHHITDLTTVLAAFRGLLDAGGHLCIADLEREDGSFHGADFDGHHGFEREAPADQLVGAGFRDVRFEDCADLRKDGHDFRVFLATAVAA